MIKDPKIVFLITASRILFVGAFLLILIVLLSSPKRFFKAKPALVGNLADVKTCQYQTFFGDCKNDTPTSTVIAVMIENHPASRPQAGLSSAKVVYEAPVEGQYTRFLALFSSSQNILKVGPVRSARPYFIDWANEYSLPLYMHVGGSNEALSKINNSPIVDVNEMSRGQWFWRDSIRHAPHNVYTSSEKWNAARETYSSSTGNPVLSWKFSSLDACTASCTTHIEVDYSEGFLAQWEYSTSTGRYARFQNGEPHRDEERQIVADTVILQFVSSTVLDAVGRLSIDTVGTGRVVVLRDGWKTEGVWKKPTSSGRTRWFDVEGLEIPLKPGIIWVQVVNEYASLELK